MDYREKRREWLVVVRVVVGLLAVFLAVGIAGGIAYGGGIEAVYLTYASWEAYALTAVLVLSVYGLWVTRHR